MARKQSEDMYNKNANNLYHRKNKNECCGGCNYQSSLCALAFSRCHTSSPYNLRSML